MKTKYQVIICSLIFLLFANQVWAADWKSLGSDLTGVQYYDESSIKKADKNNILIKVKIIYSEAGKINKFSFLRKINKAPSNPYILSHEILFLKIDCVNQKIKGFSRSLYDKRGNVIVKVPDSYGKWNKIVPKSSDEKLKNIICNSGKISQVKKKH
jgi:hypothetical protein